MRSKQADDEVVVQLATRVPAAVHRAMRLRCVETDTTVITFVIQALREKSRRAGNRTA